MYALEFLFHAWRMLLSPLAWRDTGLATLLNEEAVCIWLLGYENPNFNLIPEHVEDCLGDIMLKTALFMLREEPASIFLVLRAAWRDRWLRGGDLRGAASEPAWRMSLKAAVIWCLCEVYAASCELVSAAWRKLPGWCPPCTLHVEFLWLPALKPSFDAALKWLIWRYMLKAAI